MPVARSKSDLIRYVTEADRKLPVDQQSVFLIAPLSNKTMGQIQNLLQVSIDGQTATLLRGQQRHSALKAGLKGWENFATADGAPAVFATDKGERLVHGVTVHNPPSDESLEMIPIADYEEIADAILNANRLNDDDRKN
jgi:hypothetical protein